METFGEFVRIKRVQNRLTLREFCRLMRLDPSNWSKIERGVLSPPRSAAILEEIATALKFKKDGEDYHALKDLAVISSIPKSLADDDSIVDKLPVLFRTLRGQKPTRRELEELVRLVKEK